MVTEPGSYKGAYLELWVRSGFVWLLILLIGGGLTLLFGVHNFEMGEELWREIAMAMLVAGIVGLSVEVAVHKRSKALFQHVTGQVVKPHFQGVMESLEKNESGMKAMESRLDELSDLLRNNNLRALGVRQIYSNRWDPNLLDYLSQAQGGSTIRLLAVCLTGLLIEPAKRTMLEVLKKHCTLQILLIDPDSDIVRIRALEEIPDATEAQIEEFRRSVRNNHDTYIQFMRNLQPSEFRARLDIRHYDAAPTHFLLDNGTSVLVGFYLRGRRGDDCPHLELEVKPEGVAKPFQAHFEALWNMATQVDRREANESVPAERRRPQLVPDLPAQSDSITPLQAS